MVAGALLSAEIGSFVCSKIIEKDCRSSVVNFTSVCLIVFSPVIKMVTIALRPQWASYVEFTEVS